MFGNSRKNKAQQQQPAQAIPHVAAPSQGTVQANAQVKKLSRIAGVLAALAVAGAGFGASAVATTNATLSAAKADQQAVVVAKQSVKAGTKLTSDMIEMKNVPAAYRSAAATSDASAVVGKLAAVDLGQGEQLSASDFGGDESAQTLSVRIAADKVAVCVDVTAANGFSGELLVGDKVSVYNTKDMSEQGPSSAALAEDATVVSLGGASDNSSSSYATATLEVTPGQSREITAAKADGGVSLVLHPKVQAAKAAE